MVGVNLEDGAGRGIDLSSSRFGRAPSFFAGSFTLDANKQHHLAYSFLTRQDFDVRILGSRIDSRDVDITVSPNSVSGLIHEPVSVG